ncbi:MAG: pyrroline-5-carboxylate reductase [Gammaproteobacteria bacterium]
MTTPTIAIIGAGNMGLSLIGGLIKDQHPPSHIIAADPSVEKLTQLEQRFSIKTTSDNKAAVIAADVVIFAVKPQYFANVAKELAPIMQDHHPLVISIAAGIRISHIQHWLGDHIAIVRSMPNTPALIGCGATALYANDYVSAEQRNLAESMLRAVGITIWLEKEALMDTVTALSGSGPAYFFLMMESLQAAAEEMGLPTETARLLTLQTALGAARIAMESNSDLTELRQHVTSPGGTTEKAISVLEENNIRELFKKTLAAAKSRSEELAEILGEK